VSVSDLVDRELFSSSEKKASGLLMYQHKQRSHRFHAGSHALNGTGRNTKTLISALERVTQQENLRFMTMSPFDGALSPFRMAHKGRTWCPRCFEDRLATGGIIYEPLLWTIDIVTICHLHRQPLEKNCPSCGRESKYLTAYIRPGYCAHCRAWLGSAARQPEFSGPDTNLAYWHAKSIGELFTLAPHLDTVSLAQTIKDNLLACMQAVTEGNLLLFARICGIHKTSLWLRVQATDGYLMPVNVLLAICDRLDIPLIAFFETDFSKASLYWEHAARMVQADRMGALRPSPALLRLLLEETTREQPPPSLSDVATRLGYKATWSLHRVDKAICVQISKNHKQSGQSHYWRRRGSKRICEMFDLKQLLEESLARDKPVPVLELAKNVGYANGSTLRGRHPALCAAIDCKISAGGQERLAIEEEVLKVALKESPAPTLSTLRKRLGYPSSWWIKARFPDLYTLIQANRKTHQSKRIAEIGKQLERILAETPAPSSLAMVQKRVGISQAYLAKLFPKLCAALIERCLGHRHEAALLRRTQLVAEIQWIVQNLSLQNKTPTVRLVRSLLQPTSIKDRTVLSEAIKTARSKFPAILGSV
jgi:AraC-like DNA-binding protein